MVICWRLCCASGQPSPVPVSAKCPPLREQCGVSNPVGATGWSIWSSTGVCLHYSQSYCADHSLLCKACDRPSPFLRCTPSTLHPPRSGAPRRTPLVISFIDVSGRRRRGYTGGTRNYVATSNGPQLLKAKDPLQGPKRLENCNTGSPLRRGASDLQPLQVCSSGPSHHQPAIGSVPP